MHDRININTPYFIVFCRGCCSISQRENQLHGKILLKTLILNNRVRLDKEFGSFYFTIVFFAQILWLLIFSIATEFSLWLRFDLCSFAPARRQKIKNGGNPKMKKVSVFIKQIYIRRQNFSRNGNAALFQFFYDFVCRKRVFFVRRF